MAAAMVLAGAVMLASTFMPWLGKFSGYGLLDRGIFSAEFYAEGNLTRIYTVKPAVILTGLWPMILGTLLIAAGILFLFNLQRIGRWAAMVIGLCAVVIATIDILMIRNRLGPDVAVQRGLWILLAAGVAACVLGVLLIPLRRDRPSPRDPEG